MAKANGTLTPAERFDDVITRLAALEDGQHDIIRKVDLLWWKVGSVSAFISAMLTSVIWYFRLRGA